MRSTGGRFQTGLGLQDVGIVLQRLRERSLERHRLHV